jgi:hypothetical protein
LINSVKNPENFARRFSMPKSAGKTFSNQQLGMGVYTKLAMILEIE